MSTLLSLKNLLRVASSMALLALICTPVHGQWTKVPASAIPRGPDGKPNLAAPAPRLSDGRPLTQFLIAVVARGSAACAGY